MPTPRFLILTLATLASCIPQKAGLGHQRHLATDTAKAHATHAIDTAKTPAQKVAQLVAHYRELAPVPARQRKPQDALAADTLVVLATVPAVSTLATDGLAIDSLLGKLRLAATQVGQAQVAALRMGLAAELATRPRLTRDTTRVLSGGLLLEAWVDARGQVQARAMRGQAVLARNAPPAGTPWQRVRGWGSEVLAGGYWLLGPLGLAAFVLIFQSITRARKKKDGKPK